ncbi:polysaccharide biosynthesis tyrosine autokinase [Coriobacteriia bacterium Es71-Z0120]|uniref:polysaccharide biosynthesis tyrosine autokinase n=1 Tax=Parvivirga hydrogeniphila TaxID=2939460 RepID=UPI002260F14F|nr:polysaccharide biosynthesis tyrosine autokinase [Parvivirga hydrogeniphila]MCL4079021.1 polysaccharide biosynthesis tyrosine autokinase [Parvivirga hydrogeniphila]
MELRDYLAVIRARKWVIIQAAVIVTITAVIASLLMPPVYEGTAKVLISEKDAGAALLGQVFSEFSQPERGLQTQVQLMQIRPLLENTIRKLGLKMTPEELLKNVEIKGVGQTNIVEITAKSRKAETAADIANTLADEFVAWSKDYKRESIRAAADEVERRLESAKQEILDLGREIQEKGKSDELATELSIAINSYTDLAGRLEELRIQEQLEPGSGRVVSPAVVAAEPVEPRPVRNGVLGLAVGLIFGLGMAFLYEYLDDTVKSTEQVEEILGAPVLGIIPAEKIEKDEKRRLTLVTHPGTAAAEAYRVLRNSLDFVNFQHDIASLMITSAAPAEGKSTVAANLAAGLAQAGKKVAYVNCDFRKPTTHHFFAVSNSVGLSDVLAGTVSLKSALQRVGDVGELLVLTSGKLPPNPSELLGSEKMRLIVEELKNWADWVIIDTPPLLAVADGSAVARWADGILFVSKAGVTARGAIRQSAELLQQVGARVIGAVVWGLDSSAGGSSYYYGGKGYAGYYRYADYYKQYAGDEGGFVQGGHGGGKSGARTGEIYIPPVSPMRKFLASVGRIMAGVLAFLAVVAIVAAVVYFVDQAFGWGIVQGLLR